MNITADMYQSMTSEHTVRGHAFRVVQHPHVGVARILTSDLWAALAALPASVGLHARTMDGDSMVCFELYCGTDLAADWSDASPEAALRYLLATELTSWDDFPGFEDY